MPETSSANKEESQPPQTTNQPPVPSHSGDGLLFALDDFAYQRSALQALAFYITYLIVVAILGGLAAAIGYIFGLRDKQASQLIGGWVGVIACLAIGYLILKKKGLLKNYLYLGVGVLGVLAALFFGAILGLLPAAFLTTRKAK